MLTPLNAELPQPRLIAEKISCQRGELRLINDLDFSLHPQQLLRIIGANGSGKTSLLRIIAGLNEPVSGHVYWNEQLASASDDFAANVGYIGHRDGLKGSLTVIENLQFYQQMHTSLNIDSIEKTLHQLGILHVAELPASRLSFGQRRRLAFARLLVAPLTLWLLDEPFTGIDVSGRELIEQICVDHLTQQGMIIMTHHGSLDDSPLQSYEQQLILQDNNG